MRKYWIVVFVLLALVSGSVAAQDPSVVITDPFTGSEVDIAIPVVVSGTSANLTGDITVRALDSANNVLAEQTITAGATWQASLNLTAVTPGTPGSIYAFTLDPVDQSVAAQSLVNVTFGRGQLPDSDSDGVVDEDDVCPDTPGDAGNNGCPIEEPPPANQQPAITITAPAGGTNVPTAGAVAVSGNAAALFEGNLIVQARDGSNNVLAQQILVADGAWTASLTVPGITAPTAGNIYAYSPDGNDGISAQAQVNVTFIQPGDTGSPTVAITAPANNAQININNAVAVSGTAANLPAQNVRVVADNGSGTVFADQTVAVANGAWQASLTVTVESNTAGRIVVTAINPTDNSVVATATINVTFQLGCQVRETWSRYYVTRGDTVGLIAQRTGTTVNEIVQASCLTNPNLIEVGQELRVPQDPTLAPRLNIVLPGSGRTVDPAQGVFVSGVGRNLPDGSIMVRALDASNNILAQQIITVGATTQGDWANWQASLFVQVQQGTAGTIFAYSPATGNPVVTASVPILFGQGSETPTPTPEPTEDESTITMLAPPANSVFPINTPGNVNGSSVIFGSLAVRALDSNGNVLAEAPAVAAQLALPPAESNWNASLTVDAPSGERGVIFAYSHSPTDGHLEASVAANVVFGQVLAGPFVTIIDPVPYALIEADETTGQFTVSGLGGQLFDGNVTVRAVDEDGEILAEAPVLLNTAGIWEASLSVDVNPGTRGMIRAFAVNPQDRAVVAAMQVPVVYGDPEDAERYVFITAPLPQTSVNAQGVMTVVGFAGGTFDGTVNVDVLDPSGSVIVTQPATVDVTTGAWQLGLNINTAVGGMGSIRASIASPADGAIIVSDSVALDIIAPPTPVPAATDAG
jgi:LysM repeat protein